MEQGVNLSHPVPRPQKKRRLVLRSRRSKFTLGGCLGEATTCFSEGGGVSALFCECRESPEAQAGGWDRADASPSPCLSHPSPPDVPLLICSSCCQEQRCREGSSALRGSICRAAKVPLITKMHCTASRQRRAQPGLPTGQETQEMVVASQAPLRNTMDLGFVL